VKRRGRRRHGKRRAAAGVFIVVVAVAFAWLITPRILERLPLFRVQQVDLVGVKHLAPDAVITALRIPAGASVFLDTHLLADRVKGLRGVAQASVVRRWPGTLEVRVSEVEPAAFVASVPGGSLVAVDAAGGALPYDPERTGLDLPVATADPGVVAVLAVVQAVNPDMFQSVIAARGMGRSGVVLELGAYRILLRRDAGPAEIRAVALVARDLAARRRRYTELDARFAGQVVVRRRAPAERAGRGGPRA
jgi:cell division septal protein FtsQ